MDFQDRLRAGFAKADASIADERLDHRAATGRGKQLRRMRVMAVATGAAILIGAIVFGGNSLLTDADGGPRLQPAGPPTASPTSDAPRTECEEAEECPTP